MNKNREDNNLHGLKHKKVRMIQTKQFTKKNIQTMEPRIVK